MRLFYVTVILALLILSSHTVLAGASTGPVSSGDAIYQVHVTSITLDPPVFFPSETGTVTVELMNSGNQTVTLSNPTILDTHFKVLNDNSYGPVVHLGPGNTMTYSFLVSPDAALDGTYFPLFTVGTLEAGSVSYPFQAEVDSRNLTAIIVDKPDNFSLGTQDTVNLSIVNPRNGPVKNIMITPSGAGVDVIPTQQFISSLAAGASQDISFQVTPHQESDLTFNISYDNGNNEHSADVVLPLNLGVNKVAAVPVINNVALTSLGAGYQLTGDVTNAGITDASGMVLTVDAPVHPIQPYAEYAIGSLASDDFSSFTLTFAASNLSDVPVEIHWKDAAGNPFSTVNTLDLRSFTNSTPGPRSSGIFGLGGGGGSGLPVFSLVIIGSVVVVAGIVLWIKRKQIIQKLKKQ